MTEYLPLYYETGQGLPVVFSHGTFMDWTMFEPQIDALKDSYHVLAFNHRARTANYKPGYKLADLVEDCRQLVDERGIDRFVLAGMSMGGFMSIEFALRYPERLSGLILIDTMAGPYTAEEQVEFGAEFKKLDSDGPVPLEVAEWAAKLCFGPTTYARNRALVDYWVDRWCKLPARSVYGEGNSWLDKADRNAALGDLDIPTLIVHGDEDVVLPPDRAAQPMAENLRDGRLVLLPDAGHTGNLENVEATNAAIVSFLDEIPAPSS